MSEQAKRVESYDECLEHSEPCYFKLNGVWYINLPDPHATGNAFLGNLGNHTIEEHEDGTISVTPSILITGHNGKRHGYLTCGAWIELP